MIRKPPLFSGWYLVGLMIISMMLIYGIRMSFSVLFAPILDEFEWYRGSTALMLSLNILIYGLIAPVAGSLVDRWKPRRVAITGILVLAVATAGCAFVSQLWHFYLLFGFLAPIGTALCAGPVINPTIINWFGKRRGLALGLGQIGGGLSFAYGMLIDAVVSGWGWRPSFFVMAGMLIAIALPLYVTLFYYRPEDKRLKAYGTGELEVDGGEDVNNMPVRDWTLGRAVRTYNLWLLVLTQLCYWGTGNYLVLAHQIKFAEDAGYSSALAASVFALFGITSIFGQLCASMSDAIGREKTVILASVLAVGAMFALISVTDTSRPWLLYTYAMASGFATGLYSPTIFAGLADMFHGRNIGAISAMVLTGTGVGGALGPWLGGWIYETTGSYRKRRQIRILTEIYFTVFLHCKFI